MCFLSVAPAEIRHAYEQFLIAVSDLIDGEVSSDELQQSGSLIYDIVHDLDTPATGPAFIQKRYIKLLVILSLSYCFMGDAEGKCALLLFPEGWLGFCFVL